MTHTNINKVNNIAECNLLHYILNPLKTPQKLNNHYYSILHVCINTRKGKAKFKKFQILLDSECSSTIVMGRLIEKLHPKEDAVIQ